jgi:hypothetical protein
VHGAVNFRDLIYKLQKIYKGVYNFK